MSEEEENPKDKNLLHSLLIASGRIEQGVIDIKQTSSEQKERLDHHSTRLTNLERFQNLMLGMGILIAVAGASLFAFFTSGK